MRTRAALPLLAGLAAIAFARAAAFAPAPLPKNDKANAKSELKKLAGTWSLAGLSRGGKDMPVADRMGTIKAVIAGDRWKFTRPGMPRSMPEYVIVLDVAKKPRHMDLKRADVKEGMVVRGIYKLEGDTLTFCYFATTARGAAKGGEPQRPKDFKTVDDRTHTMILKRTKR
jgi:uncharacterized protein (TIGR03067 family)